MEKIKRMKVEDLNGYRIPLAEEKKQIYSYIKKELVIRRKQMQIFRSIFACLGVVMTLGSAVKILNGIYDSEMVAGTMIAIIFWTAFMALHKNIIKNRFFEINIRNGKYKVLDCLSYEHHYAQDSTRTEGSVRIQTKEGIPCQGNFIVDIETALLSEKGENIPLLLVYDEKTEESRVFSKKMLEGR